MESAPPTGATVPEPLDLLVGVWVGEAGSRLAPDKNGELLETAYRERVVAEAIGRVDERREIYAVRTRLKRWALPLEDEVLEESAYWLFDAETEQLSLALSSPRGTVLLAGGHASPDDKKFTVAAEVGSPSYGICRAPSHAAEPAVLRYEASVEIDAQGLLSYRSILFTETGEPDVVSRRIRENTLAKIPTAG